MVAVINYGQEKPVLLLDALSILSINYIFTENEIEITRADKVIFHSEDSPEILIRKLHFENLFSMLRICQKPMLVIGIGFSICGEKIINLKQVGLGLVHREVSILEKEVSGFFNIEVVQENKIFNTIKENKFSFNSRLFLPQDNNTIAVIPIDGVKYSAAMQKGNLTGIQFYPEKSGEDGLTILNNWNNSF